jgi:hypothetical protein
VCYCLKLRRETPAGVALGVTDWKVVKRVWRPPSGKRTHGLPWRVAGAERTRTRQIGRQTTAAQETAPAAFQLTAYRDERPPRLRPRGQVRFAAPLRIVTLAARNAVPTIEQLREFTAAGGLISYGPNVTDTWRLVGVYSGRILNGEKPDDLPVQQSTKIELTINMKTAKALGLSFPETLLATAYKVIE